MQLYLYTIFSRFIQTQMSQCIHLYLYKVRETSKSGKRDLGEERGEQKNMYIYNFFSLYTNKNAIHLCMYKSERDRERAREGEWRARV